MKFFAIKMNIIRKNQMIVAYKQFPRLDRQTSTYGASTKTFNNNTREGSQPPASGVPGPFFQRILIYSTPNVHHTAAYVRNVHNKLARTKHSIKT